MHGRKGEGRGREKMPTNSTKTRHDRLAVRETVAPTLPSMSESRADGGRRIRPQRHGEQDTVGALKRPRILSAAQHRSGSQVETVFHSPVKATRES